MNWLAARLCRFRSAAEKEPSSRPYGTFIPYKPFHSPLTPLYPFMPFHFPLNPLCPFMPFHSPLNPFMPLYAPYTLPMNFSDKTTAA